MTVDYQRHARLPETPPASRFGISLLGTQLGSHRVNICTRSHERGKGSCAENQMHSDTSLTSVPRALLLKFAVKKHLLSTSYDLSLCQDTNMYQACSVGLQDWEGQASRVGESQAMSVLSYLWTERQCVPGCPQS